MTIFNIYNTQKDLKISKQEVKNLFSILIAYKKISVDEIEINFVTDKMMRKKHQEIFEDPTSTDCITCPIDDPFDKENPYCFLGTCYICPKTALEYAKTKNTDPYEELTLYCVHCFLHLLGYDDIDPKERKKMRAQEKICLNILREKNSYLKL